MLGFARRAARLLFGAAVLVVACTDQRRGLRSLSDPQRVSPYTPPPRIYYLAAEDTNWNYAPLGRDPVYDRSLPAPWGDRKSTRLNSSHGYISYAVFCLKKKKTADPAIPGCPVPARLAHRAPRRVHVSCVT